MLCFKEWLYKFNQQPKVLWITGMNSSGKGPIQLEKLGFDVKNVPTSTDYWSAGLGRAKRYPVIKQVLGKKANYLADKHMLQNALAHNRTKVTDKEEFIPDIVIGTSQGGALVMKLAHQYPHAKFVLSAPAWKIFNVEPKCPPGTIILHGKRDITVPLADSQELAKLNGAQLIVTDDKHNVDFSHIAKAAMQQARILGMNVTGVDPQAMPIGDKFYTGVPPKRSIFEFDPPPVKINPATSQPYKKPTNAQLIRKLKERQARGL